MIRTVKGFSDTKLKYSVISSDEGAAEWFLRGALAWMLGQRKGRDDEVDVIRHDRGITYDRMVSLLHADSRRHTRLSVHALTHKYAEGAKMCSTSLASFKGAGLSLPPEESKHETLRQGKASSRLR